MQRPIAMSLALVLSLFGCAGVGDSVPLVTDDTEAGGACWLLHQTVDVVAEPTSGTPVVKGSNASLQWPRGYTAHRAGTEVQVLDESGRLVLTTGGRYELAPTPTTDYTEPLSKWVIGCVTPCPDCQLGPGLD